MSFISDLKDSLVRKISTSFLLRAIDGRKTEVARGLQGVNLIVTGSYVLAKLADQYAGTHITPAIDPVITQLGLLTSWLAGQGFYELGKADSVAKARLDSK
jgi:hypothetical protein